MATTPAILVWGQLRVGSFKLSFKIEKTYKLHTISKVQLPQNAEAAPLLKIVPPISLLIVSWKFPEENQPITSHHKRLPSNAPIWGLPHQFSRPSPPHRCFPQVNRFRASPNSMAPTNKSPQTPSRGRFGPCGFERWLGRQPSPWRKSWYGTGPRLCC